MGLFGSSTNQSQAQSSGSGAAGSGYGEFSPTTNINFSKPLIDFKSPAQLLGLALVLASGYFAWRKFK